MNNSNQNKADFLGMPYGTACSRLRKNLLFQMAQKLNLDKCFKCDGIIETSEELSIEHMEPWLNRSTELFWDLDNIAFSHLKCNRPHEYKGGWSKHHEHLTKRKTGSNNWYCYKCGEREKKFFTKNAYKKDGIEDICRDCRYPKNKNGVVP